jgi:hypothetical protein
MTEPTHDRMAPEALLERIADGEATTADWAAFRAAADIEPSLWQDLAESQRTHAELCAQVQEVVAVAEHVEAPFDVHVTEGLARRIRVVASWGGWAAAAAVLLVWKIGLAPGIGGGSTAGLLPGPGTPEDALKSYIDRGQKSGIVVGEMPTKVMIETRPTGDGQGYEVIYLRQIMERQLVPKLYRMVPDESGRPHAVPAEDILQVRVRPN